jgi:DNA-binding transcriptional regulator YdaS (Cro superfamily)
MTLPDWMRLFEKTNLWLAERCAVSEEAVRLWRAGKRQPSPMHARRIEVVSQGKVKQHDVRK